VFHHIYQWVKFEIIILDDSSDMSANLWRHVGCKLSKMVEYSLSFTYQTNWNISETNHKNKKLQNKLHYSLKSSLI
jgi:hypothetical protein